MTNTMYIIHTYKCSDWYCKNWPGLGCLDPRESSPAVESVADSTRWSRPGLRTWQFDNIEIIDSYLFFGNHFVFLNVMVGALEIMNLQRSTTWRCIFDWQQGTPKLNCQQNKMETWQNLVILTAAKNIFSSFLWHMLTLSFCATAEQLFMEVKVSVKLCQSIYLTNRIEFYKC